MRAKWGNASSHSFRSAHAYRRVNDKLRNTHNFTLTKSIPQGAFGSTLTSLFITFRPLGMRRPRSKPTNISNISRGVELGKREEDVLTYSRSWVEKADTVKQMLFKHGCRTCNSCINSYWSAAKLLIQPSSSNNPPCAGVCDILRAFSRRGGSLSKWRVKEITIPDIIYYILYLNFRLLRVTTSSGSISQLWNLEIFKPLVTI